MKASSAIADRVRIFGAGVRAARQTRGWTQAELARRAGLGVVTITKIEAGSPGVAYGTVLELCSMLNLSPDPDQLAQTSAQVRTLTTLAGQRKRVRRPRVEPALDV